MIFWVPVDSGCFVSPSLPSETHSLSHGLRSASLTWVTAAAVLGNHHSLGTSNMLGSSLKLRLHLCQCPLFRYNNPATACHQAPLISSPGVSTPKKSPLLLVASPELFLGSLTLSQLLSLTPLILQFSFYPNQYNLGDSYMLTSLLTAWNNVSWIPLDYSSVCWPQGNTMRRFFHTDVHLNNCWSLGPIWPVWIVSVKQWFNSVVLVSC